MPRESDETTRTSTRHQAPVNKGMILFAEDIVARYFTRDGQAFRTRNWVIANFAPDVKRKLGRDPVWLEAEADEWMQNLPRWRQRGD